MNALDKALEQNRKNQISGQPQFDVQRLAKEIDGIFQEQLKDSGTVLTAELSTFEQSVKSLTNVYEEKVLNVEVDIRKTYMEIKTELIEEIAKGRATIIMPDTSEVHIGHMDHPRTEAVVKSLHLTKKAMLVGPAGTGKTYMVAGIAEKLNLPFYKYSCSRDSSVHDLLGYKQPKSEEYLETVFLKAYETGGVFLVDEYDAMSGDMALFFNGIADASKFISIPHRDVKPIATRHKDFLLVMCGNTWGKGSHEFSGRDFQDNALMDRFRLCRHHIGYHTVLEDQFMGDNISFARQLRKSFEKIDSYLSTRNIEDISILLNSGSTQLDVTVMLTEDLEKMDKDTIHKDLERFFNKDNSTQKGIPSGKNSHFIMQQSRGERDIWEPPTNSRSGSTF